MKLPSSNYICTYPVTYNLPNKDPSKVESNLLSASHHVLQSAFSSGCSAVINKIIISAVHQKRHDDLVLGNPQRGSVWDAPPLFTCVYKDSLGETSDL